MNKPLYIVILLVFFLTACSASPSVPQIESTVAETAIANPTITPPTAIQTPIPPTSTPDLAVIFEDNFEDDDSGWAVREDGNYSVYYHDGKYHIGGRKNTENYFVSNPNIGMVDDFSLSVDISHNPDYNVTSGVLFRYQDDSNYYLLWLFHFGGFALVRNLKGSITAIGGTSTADFINQGGEVNRVRIRSVQDEISVSINDEIVVLTKDSSFGEGEIRLYASAAENNEHYEAIFDNLVVKNISEISEQVPINFEYNTTIRDDFDDDSSPWLSNLASGGSIDESQVFVQNNRLHVTGLKTTYLGSHQNFSGFTDFILDMGISLSEGGSCLAGISFRTDPTGGEGYVFYLDSDGILKLVEINQGEGDVLAEYGRIPIKFDVENSNHVRIEAVGPRIAVYINDVLFTYLYDNTISSGDILLFVDFSGQELCSIVFDYLEISYQN